MKSLKCLSFVFMKLKFGASETEKSLTNVFTLSLDLQSHFIRLTREFCIRDLKRGDEII